MLQDDGRKITEEQFLEQILRSSCETDNPKPRAMISSVSSETFLLPRSKSETYVRRRPK
jgi:hypothetical protein